MNYINNAKKTTMNLKSIKLLRFFIQFMKPLYKIELMLYNKNINRDVTCSEGVT